jgi:hypothetical protein
VEKQGAARGGNRKNCRRNKKNIRKIKYNYIEKNFIFAEYSKYQYLKTQKQ